MHLSLPQMDISKPLLQSLNARISSWRDGRQWLAVWSCKVDQAGMIVPATEVIFGPLARAGVRIIGGPVPDIGRACFRLSSGLGLGLRLGLLLNLSLSLRLGLSLSLRLLVLRLDLGRLSLLGLCALVRDLISWLLGLVRLRLVTLLRLDLGLWCIRVLLRLLLHRLLRLVRVGLLLGRGLAVRMKLLLGGRLDISVLLLLSRRLLLLLRSRGLRRRALLLGSRSMLVAVRISLLELRLSLWLRRLVLLLLLRLLLRGLLTLGMGWLLSLGTVLLLILLLLLLLVLTRLRIPVPILLLLGLLRLLLGLLLGVLFLRVRRLAIRLRRVLLRDVLDRWVLLGRVLLRLLRLVARVPDGGFWRTVHALGPAVAGYGPVIGPAIWFGRTLGLTIFVHGSSRIVLCNALLHHTLKSVAGLDVSLVHDHELSFLLTVLVNQP